MSTDDEPARARSSRRRRRPRTRPARRAPSTSRRSRPTIPVRSGKSGQKLTLFVARSRSRTSRSWCTSRRPSAATPRRAGTPAPLSASGGIVCQPLRASSKWHGPGSWAVPHRYRAKSPKTSRSETKSPSASRRATRPSVADPRPPIALRRRSSEPSARVYRRGPWPRTARRRPPPTGRRAVRRGHPPTRAERRPRTGPTARSSASLAVITVSRPGSTCSRRHATGRSSTTSSASPTPSSTAGST